MLLDIICYTAGGGEAGLVSAEPIREKEGFDDTDGEVLISWIISKGLRYTSGIRKYGSNLNLHGAIQRVAYLALMAIW